MLAVEVRPSGVTRWNYDAAVLPEGLFVAAGAVSLNLLGRLVFRGGSTIRVRDEEGKARYRKRFRRRQNALAAMDDLQARLAASGLRSLDP